MLIKRRFLNTKVKIVTAVMAVGVIVSGALFTLPMDNAKGAGSPYPPTDSENWNPEPVWRDEFDGNSLDGTKWTALNGGWKDENQQVRNCYTRSDENINVSGGSLNLIGLYKPGATCTGGNTKTGNFTSGFVQTKNKAYFKYGYIEARIKMPKNKSTWPGFWMSPNNSPYGPGWPDWGEIDIVEAKGSNRQFAASDAHWRDKNTPTGQTGSHRNRQGVIPSSKFGTNDTTEWHTYGVKWTEGKLEYFIDGELHHTITEFKNSNSTGSPNGPFDQDFFLRLNLAIGGNYIDAPWDDPINSVGAANGEGFPATMSVDYVRVYEMRKPKEVEVKDTELRKLLNEKLGEKLGTTRAANQKITDVELEKLTDLNLDNSNITNLAGIEAAKNLKNLSLNHNSISNLSPLAGLTSLKTLSLKENKITDISPLTGLTSLTSLNLEDQQSSIKPTDKSFASPLKDLAGNVVSVTSSADVINSTATPGNIQLLSLPASGASPILNTLWTRSVTIGAVSATFSGTLAIDTSAIPRTAQPQPQPQPHPQPHPQPQPQPANPSAATHNPVNKPQNTVSGLLANTGFNVFLGVIAVLALVAAGLLILR
jgi:endo-beta-1,3-glucanase